MWREYSSSYLKRNRSAGASIAIATLISALLLSLLCGIFYNLWKYEVERIELEVGGWQSRIAGEFTSEEIEIMEGFANVEKVEAAAREGAGAEPAAELYFRSMRSARSDTPRIAERLGVPREGIDYNYELLAMYLVRVPGDAAPRLVFPLFLAVALAASASLAAIIHSAFAVSMGARIRQLGILSSVGATPRQIRACLMQEAAALCAAPLAAGILLGIAGSAGFVHLTNALLGSGTPGRHEAAFGYHPLVLGAALLLTAGTIGVSAWLPARRLSRRGPLEAIRDAGELELRRRRRSPLLALLFGAEGELAGSALKAQRRAQRTASLSLTLAFLAFTVMQSFFTLSEISTRETYFERYRDVWDVMATVEGVDVDAFAGAERIRELPGVRSAIAYQRAAAKRIVAGDELSDEVKSAGGFAAGRWTIAAEAEGGWMVSAPIVALDDASFRAYCERLGVAPALDGAILLNQIRDASNPDFRHPTVMPYVREDGGASVLRSSEGAAVKVPVLAYVRGEDAPALREEYATLDYCELVHFISASLWREIRGQLGGAAEETKVCVLGREGATAEELDALQGAIDGLLAGTCRAESENRLRQAATNDRQLRGMMAIFGSFCALLAVIGIGSVFSNALGFVRQRRREFARYMSIGMTPGEIKKMFCIEGLAVAGRPMLIALPVAAVAVGAMLRASYMDAGTFLAEAPLLPVALLALAIWGTVALAYCLGWRSLRRIDLAEVLRDDTMM